MKIFITGATGYLGNMLAHRLAHAGHCVHALIRDKGKAGLLDHAGIRIFEGDVNNRGTIRRAIKGCQQVYHAAAQVKPWMRNPSAIYQVNADGTFNILEEAANAGVQKLVFTSTAGVLGPTPEQALHETSSRKNGYTSHYDRSKKLAEHLVAGYVQQGLNAVIVNPAKVFGPGHTSHGLTANAIIKNFIGQKITFIPWPGSYILCFAYVSDVVNGHIQAMEKGIAGERYILGGHNISYHDFFERVQSLARFRGRIICVPKPVVKLFARMQLLRHKITGQPPLFSPKLVDQAFNHHAFSSMNAIQQLGYSITPLDEALMNTIKYLNTTQ